MNNVIVAVARLDEFDSISGVKVVFLFPPIIAAKAGAVRNIAAALVDKAGVAEGVVAGEANSVRAANSFEVVAREWIAKNTPTWAATHASKIVRRLEMYVFPWLGGKPIAEIVPVGEFPQERRIGDLRGILKKLPSLGDDAENFARDIGEIVMLSPFMPEESTWE